jgi:hypothetical protein
MCVCGRQPPNPMNVIADTGITLAPQPPPPPPPSPPPPPQPQPPPPPPPQLCGNYRTGVVFPDCVTFGYDHAKVVQEYLAKAAAAQ